MMKAGVFGVIGIIYILFWLIYSAAYFSSTYSEQHFYIVYLTVGTGITMTIPFILGYFEGKQHNK